VKHGIKVDNVHGQYSFGNTMPKFIGQHFIRGISSTEKKVKPKQNNVFCSKHGRILRHGSMKPNLQC
jgi:hypothetical protein